MVAVPRVFTCPAGAPFLETLAVAIIEGRCPGTGTAPTPAQMPDITIQLPTRRAVSALAQAFAQAGSGRGLLLPAIRALGDEEPAAIASGAPAPEVVSELERRVVLADIARQWAGETSVWSARSPALGPDPIPRNPADAVALAGDLARLIDAMEAHDISHASVAKALPQDLSHLARNWEINSNFLINVLERWAAHLQRRNLVSAVARRDRLLAQEAQRLQAPDFTDPYIVAGSTGSVPATARLLRAAAHAKNGAVVLPGLDRDLDSASWAVLEPGHPQFGMSQVIETIGVTRDQVETLGDDPVGWVPARLEFLSETMRPAATTGQWMQRLGSINKDQLAAGLDGVSLIEAANEHEEARVVALILRAVAAMPGKTAALVTPDRSLARRVRAELGRWDLVVDDSAGIPLAQTPPGVFLQLVAQAQNNGFSSLALLALLKHPLVRLGRAAREVREPARHLEILALRAQRPGPGLAGIAQALRGARQMRHAHRVRSRITPEQISRVENLLDDLTAAFAPLARFGAAPGNTQTLVPVKELLEAHIEVAQTLAATPLAATGGLWRDASGHTLADFLADLLGASEQAAQIGPQAFPGWLEAMMQGAVVRPTGGLHPRLAIWGPLEARLMRADVLVLGGLVEGTWPGEVATDPWMGRHMRAAVGLEPPEQRIGLQAHDFAQGLAGAQVFLTRAQKSGGTPAVPSRWLWRMRALLKGLDLEHLLRASQPWLAWARGLDQPLDVQPCLPPRPCPPVAVRPVRLSVTAVETWLRDPYAIYARHVLDLQPLEPLEVAPDASDYGQLIHQALGAMIAADPKAPLGEGALGRLLAVGAGCFASLAEQPGLQAYWQARFVRVAQWFVENDLRSPGTVSHPEIGGHLSFAAPVAGGKFTLTARADRIDVIGDRSADIIDYKTGGLPKAQALKNLEAPQLPLEAAIMAAGGFGDISAQVRGLIYVQLSGRDPAGEIVPVPGDPHDLAKRALELLEQRIAAFARPSQPYLSRVKPKREEFAGDYDHLARLAEWSARLVGPHGT
ncbi:MAG: double-strand break repair protein AddB [Alphaproteobacteria bacterium]